MITHSVAAKAAPIAAPTFAAVFADLIEPHSVLRLGAVVAGLAFGAAWRAAALRDEGKSWGDVRRDLGISALIGGANAVIALALTDWFGVGVLSAMAIAVLVGATGLRAVPEARDAILNIARRKLLADVETIQRRDPVAEELVRKLDEKTGDGNG